MRSGWKDNSVSFPDPYLMPLLGQAQVSENMAQLLKKKSYIIVVVIVVCLSLGTCVLERKNNLCELVLSIYYGVCYPNAA